MTKVDKFEELLMKYLNRFVANYFVSSYENIYNSLNNGTDYDTQEYYIDFGRLWGLQALMQYEMTKEDSKELLNLLLDL